MIIKGLFPFNLIADDTRVYIKNPDLSNLNQNSNSELAHIGKWIMANKLSLNIDKTVYILFSGNIKK